MIKKIDWHQRAVESEIALSVANGGRAVHYSSFTHIHNPHVPWGGDFNRAVGVKLNNFKSFEEVVEKVQAIHSSNELEVPDRFDIIPPSLDLKRWSGYLEQKGYLMLEVIFFFSAKFIYNSFFIFSAILSPVKPNLSANTAYGAEAPK